MKEKWSDMKHPYPVGTRVHHRGSLWNIHFSEEECKANPSPGWGTVIEVKGPYNDKSYEYKVTRDAAFTEGGNVESWWASYHIDLAREVEA